ncbi:MAG: hypothetical protein M1813_009115 [Trichoglossum hirsutum]|nr:MAG: hypothetical protein M1813_009115 [Trichoglossum hirsutum]
MFSSDGSQTIRQQSAAPCGGATSIPLTNTITQAIGCKYSAYDSNYGSPNNCYCRNDLQSAAKSYLTACVKSGCTVGYSSIDISSAGSIYDYYCSSLGFPVNIPATTTQKGATAVGSAANTATSPGNGNGNDNGNGNGNGNTQIVNLNGSALGLSNPSIIAIGIIVPIAILALAGFL